MIFRSLSCNFVPAICRDVFSPWSSLISGGFDTANTMLTNLANRQIARENNETQIAIADKNNAFSERMNDKNNAFASQEAQIARSAQYGHDIDMQQRQQAYDSPVEQIRRYREAGLNPSVMMEGSSAIGSSTPMGSGAAASPHGSGVTPSMPIFTTPQMLKAPNMFSSALDSLQKIADLRKTTADTGQVDALTKQIFENIRGMTLENDIKQSYGHLLADAKYQDVVKGIALKSQNIEALVAAGKRDEAEAALASLKGETEKQLSRFHGESAQQLKLANDTYFTRLRSTLELQKSQSAANYSSSAYHQAQVDEIRTLLPDRQNLLKADKALQESKVSYTNQQISESEANVERLAAETLRILQEERSIELNNDQFLRVRHWLEEEIKYRAKNEKTEFIWTPYTMATKLIPLSGLAK